MDIILMESELDLDIATHGLNSALDIILIESVDNNIMIRDGYFAEKQEVVEQLKSTAMKLAKAVKAFFDKIRESLKKFLGKLSKKIKESIDVKKTRLEYENARRRWKASSKVLAYGQNEDVNVYDIPKLTNDIKKQFGEPMKYVNKIKAINYNTPEEFSSKAESILKEASEKFNPLTKELIEENYKGTLKLNDAIVYTYKNIPSFDSENAFNLLDVIASIESVADGEEDQLKIRAYESITKMVHAYATSAIVLVGLYLTKSDENIRKAINRHPSDEGKGAKKDDKKDEKKSKKDDD